MPDTTVDVGSLVRTGNLAHLRDELVRWRPPEWLSVGRLTCGRSGHRVSDSATTSGRSRFRIHAVGHSTRAREGDGAGVQQGDLTSWTAGVSGTWAKLQFAAGVNVRLGTTDDVVVRNVLNADPFYTRVDVRTGGFIYSLAYQF